MGRLPCPTRCSFSHHPVHGSSRNSNVPHVLCVSLTLQTLHGALVLEPHYLFHPRRERHLSLCEATVTCGRCRPVRSPGRAGQRARCAQMTGCYGPICVQDHLTEESYRPHSHCFASGRTHRHTENPVNFSQGCDPKKEPGSCWELEKACVGQQCGRELTRLLSGAHLFRVVLVPAVV